MVGVAGDGVVAVDDALHAVAREGAYFAGVQVEGAQAVVDGVGDEHIVAELLAQVLGYEGEAGGLVEACFGAGAVDVALDGMVYGVVAATVGVDDGVEVGGYLQDAVACAIGDEVGTLAVAEEVCGAEFGGQFDGFTGEGVGAGGLGAGYVGAVATVQGALRLVFGDELAYEGGEALYVAFAGEVGDDVAFGVDDDEGGPCAGGVGLPGGQFGVVEYGVGDVVAVDGCGECYGVGFVFKFGAVHADGDEHVGEFFFEGAQFVEHVQAVDAAEGPEVENNDFAAQILQGEVLVAGVEPGSAFEFAGTHAYGAGGVLAHGFSLLLGAPCAGAMVCCPHYASVVGVVRRELSFVTWGLNDPSYSVTFHPGKSYRELLGPPSQT